MNRVKTVRAAYRAVMSTIDGNTRSIHRISQMPPGAKMFCISIERCTASTIASSRLASAITHRLLWFSGSKTSPLAFGRSAARFSVAQGTL